MDNVRRDCIEERAIMGSENRVRAKTGKEERQDSHDDKCSGPCLEIIFQPCQRIQVDWKDISGEQDL
jgi:hypothetical protein